MIAVVGTHCLGFRRRTQKDKEPLLRTGRLSILGVSLAPGPFKPDKSGHYELDQANFVSGSSTGRPVSALIVTASVNSMY